MLSDCKSDRTIALQNEADHNVNKVKKHQETDMRKINATR